MGVKYAQQYPNLEVDLEKVLDYLEHYSILSVPRVNYDNTESLWTTRMIR